MNWEAVGSIGEVLGSVGVLITIAYFGLQIRRMQTSTQISIASAIADRRIELHTQRLNHIDLLVKANTGSEVNEIEREKLLSLYESESASMFFAFMNFRSIGLDGQIQALNFARFLLKNPALRVFWKEELEENRYRDRPNGTWTAWTESVEQQIEVQSSRLVAF